MIIRVKIIYGATMVLVLGSAVAACGSNSKPSTQSQATAASQACSEPAEATAARIEKALSTALASSDSVWQTSGGNIEGAYKQVGYYAHGTYATAQYEPQAFNVSLFTSPKLAANAATQYSSLGAWQTNYVTDCVVLSVANSATPAEIAAAQANHG